MIHPAQEWQSHLAEGRFMIQRSRSTGGYVFYPRIAEPSTGADDLEWVEASGKGTVHAITIVRKKDPADSYNVALIDLIEGPRLMSRITGIDNDEIKIGMSVIAYVQPSISDENNQNEDREQPILLFKPE